MKILPTLRAHKKIIAFGLLSVVFGFILHEHLSFKMIMSKIDNIVLDNPHIRQNLTNPHPL